MAAVNTRPLIDKLLDGRLVEFLTKRRDVSFNRIAHDLADEIGVQVTPETLRQWNNDLGIERPSRRPATAGDAA